MSHKKTKSQILSRSNQFDTLVKIRDNDRSSLNCASMLKGGWWWKSCGRGLNGIYLTDPQDLTARQGIYFIRNISKRVKFDLFSFLKI